MKGDPDLLLHILCKALLSAARADQPDLTLRQLAVLLVVYQTAEPRTVSWLAAHLELTGSTVTRILNRLENLKLAHREVNWRDRRSMVVRRSALGMAMMERLGAEIAEASDKFTPTSFGEDGYATLTKECPA
jgi:DNA-binding MarR family transcriptional regulator